MQNDVMQERPCASAPRHHGSHPMWKIGEELHAVRPSAFPLFLF